GDCTQCAFLSRTSAGCGWPRSCTRERSRASPLRERGRHLAPVLPWPPGEGNEGPTKPRIRRPRPIMDTFKVAASRAGFAVAALGLLVVPRPALAGWPACGRAVVVAPGAQQHPAIATDGAGGAIVVWQDLRGPSVNIFARHVLANGDPDPAWPAEGRALLGDPTTLGPDVEQDSPAIVSDGRGGAIVAWQDNRSFVTATNIYAQHVLGDGTHDPAWPANGRAVCTAPGVQNSFVMIPDGASGAILAWIDGRSGPGVQHIFAGHVLAFGVMDPRWPLNGMPICTADSARGFLAIASDGSRTDDF